jgi:excisionase family DNA binding protein
MATTVADDRLLTRTQAADYLGLRPQTLAAWYCTGRHDLPAFKVGRLVKYRKADLDEWLASHRGTQSA